MNRIGLLALQGDYQAHARVLEELGQTTLEVRRAADLRQAAALVLPGGESTTMWHFLEQDPAFKNALIDFARQRPVYGTCAGVILLARQVENPTGRGLGLLDIRVERNSYGRQFDSGVQQAVCCDGTGNLEAVLIRAPRILETGPGVEVLAQLNGDPVWVRQGHVFGTTFHPELSDDRRVHRRFLAAVTAPDHSLAS